MGNPRNGYYPRCRNYFNANLILTTSVLRHLRINPLRPSRNPARQVMHFGKAGLLQELNRFRAASAHLAMGDDLAARVELAHALWQIAERNEISIQVAD